MTADDDRVAAGQAAELPGKRAADAAWTPVVPDEAVEAAARVEYARDWTAPWDSRAAAPFTDDYLHTARRMLTAAASFIVAANQPEPLPEPGDIDALATLLLDTWKRVDPKSNVALWPTSYVANFADMARVVQAYVDSQVAAARADERAKTAAARALDGGYVETPADSAANDQTLAELRDALRHHDGDNT